MYNKLEDQVLIMQAPNEKPASEFTDMNSDMKQTYSEYTKMRSYMNEINTMLTHMVIQKQYYSPEKMDPPKSQDTTTVVSANKKAPPL